MVRTVTYGKANTAMPGFDRQLNSGEIEEIVDYVRSAFMRLTPGTEKPVTAQSTEKSAQSAYPDGLLPDTNAGLAFYMQNCATCHGANGDGKGPRAYFILPKPRDFQHPASRHGLDRARLFTAISKGTRGSEMPAWEKVLTKQEIVNIAEYVFQAFIDVENEASSAVPQ
jgi:mono/diheme cytochrome c family protein